MAVFLLNIADGFLTYNFIDLSIVKEVNPVHLMVSSGNISLPFKLIFPNLLLGFIYLATRKTLLKKFYVNLLLGLSLVYSSVVSFLVIGGIKRIYFEVMM